MKYKFILRAEFDEDRDLYEQMVAYFGKSKAHFLYHFSSKYQEVEQ